MITPDQLAAHLEDELEDRACDALAAELERDPESLQRLLDQRRIDGLLRSVLAPASNRQRLKESVLAAVAGPSSNHLQARVLAETIGRGTASNRKRFPNAAETGWPPITATRLWRELWANLVAAGDVQPGPTLGAMFWTSGHFDVASPDRALWPGTSHHGAANLNFADSHVESARQTNWIAATDTARLRWNNDHEPHPETWERE